MRARSALSAFFGLLASSTAMASPLAEPKAVQTLAQTPERVDALKQSILACFDKAKPVNSRNILTDPIELNGQVIGGCGRITVPHKYQRLDIPKMSCAFELDTTQLWGLANGIKLGGEYEEFETKTKSYLRAGNSDLLPPSSGLIHIFSYHQATTTSVFEDWRGVFAEDKITRDPNYAHTITGMFMQNMHNVLKQACTPSLS